MLECNRFVKKKMTMLTRVVSVLIVVSCLVLLLSQTAFAKNTYAIECFGAIEANKGATISAVSDKNDVDIFCSGAVVNYGAEFDGETDALGGISNRD